ncbi:MAG: 3-hydroxybutyryl-CoA dehydrogenase [Chitinophagaceae bacterium]|nr:3-hydroxybutyryl-CoA dehydrogenase [Chitinophagaceae bacterium]
MDIKTICVCGAGTMGAGIAQLAAQQGFKIILFDVNPVMLAKAKADIENNLEAQVNKTRITDEARLSTLKNLGFIDQVNACIANVCIEAIVENIEAKVCLINQLAAINNTDTIFATNTSSLSIDSIAEKTVCAERVLGMHFFNPAYIMKLVEVVEGSKTHKQVSNAIMTLASQLGKTPVLCKDFPGFIVNRVARHYYLEAMKLVEEGIADIETIDEIMEASGFKMGPFRLMDLIGMDINLSASNAVYQALGKPERLQPAALQKQMVEAGKLGRKTKQGFYNY